MKNKIIQKNAGIFGDAVDGIVDTVGNAISSLTGSKEPGAPSPTGQGPNGIEYVGQARVTSNFGPRTIKELGGKPHFHGGTDIGVARGSPIYSAYDGTVFGKPYWNEHKGGMGGYDVNVKSVDEEGEFLMQYIHLDAVDVSDGQSISAGQKIGNSGTAGTGAHLHLQKKRWPSKKLVETNQYEREASTRMRILDKNTRPSGGSTNQNIRPPVIKQDSISVPFGTVIYSIKEGIASVHKDNTEGFVVMVADPVAFGFGNFFGLGGGDSFVYSGLSTIRVKDGDKVTKGQPLGVSKIVPSDPSEAYTRITKNVGGKRVQISQQEQQMATRVQHIKTFAPVGVMNTNASRPVDAPIKGMPGQRDATTYNNVIGQFKPSENPRYEPRPVVEGGKKQTFCNIFVSDVTAAMGAALPHWVDKNGNPGQPGRGFYELNANASIDWLVNHGPRFGWKEVSEKEAQQYANSGHPVVAGQKEIGKSKIGHVAVIRPGSINQYGPAVANVGAVNVDNSNVAKVFGSGYKQGLIRYWANLS